MSADETYEIYAIEYGRRDGRRAEHFLGGDPHDAPMPMSYFVWVVVGRNRSWVIDTGFEAEDAVVRGRTMLRPASEGVGLVGIDAAKVEDIVVTHLHYDHIGGFDQFPNARFHLQEQEMAYATGRHMASPAIGHAFTADQIAGMVHKVFDGRVVFYDGEAEVAPGLTVHLVGGHTMGLQVVRVRTKRGWVVLASDASHYYENMDTGRPFPIAYNVGDMLRAYDTVRRLADSPSHIIPGHDPVVLERYPAADPSLEGIAVRVDLAPR